MRVVKRKFSAEFKAAVVNAVTQEGRAVKEVAAQWGISGSMVRRWVVESRLQTFLAAAPLCDHSPFHR